MLKASQLDLTNQRVMSRWLYSSLKCSLWYPHKYRDTQVNSFYLDDFMLHHGVQPLDEGLHCGVFSQQLLQLLKDCNRVI